MPDWLCPYDYGSLLRLYICPGARSPGISGLHGGRVKIRVSSLPRDGEANREVVSYLSQILNVPKKDVEILRGETGRSKDVYVNLPPEKIMVLLKLPS